MVRPNTRDSDDSSDEEPEPVHRVNGKEAITGMEKGLVYMEQGGFTTEEMDYIRVLTDRMRALQLKSKARRNSQISFYRLYKLVENLIFIK